MAVLAAWLAVAAFGGMAQGSLSEVQENDQAAFLPSSAESTRADELAQEFAGDQPLPALVVATPSGGGELAQEQLAAAEEFVTQVPEVELPDGQALGDVLDGEIALIPAEDGQALLFPVPIDEELSNELLGDTGERVVNVVVAEL
ncbi:MAG TPA: hypothetical protein VK046_03120, partial [Actinomycetaceae bacterium]|nr:hypothetical protein [Actinomycetaceae bacterium]